MGPHSPGPSDNHPLCPLIAPSTVDFTMAQYTFDSSLFSQTMNNSAMTSTPLPPPSVEAMPTTIKMEMIENYDHSPSPAHHSSNSSESSQTPGPSTTESKPVKKRKSWGQVLPEPKTSLPPRKRAKTEDEKEQRRIERVKRNRLAAHNSRERKRQEYEVLQTEKDELEANMQAYKQKMAEMEAELRYYRSKYPGEAPQPVFDLATPPSDSFDTICPAQIPTSFPSPESMDSPRDSSCQPETPPSSFEASPEFDSTQYPAVSVDFGNLSTGDLGLPFSVQPYAPVDEKSVVMENFFDFEPFPKFSPTPFDHSSFSNSYAFLDGFDAKFNDLQSASGA